MKKIIIGVLFIVISAAAARGVWAWQVARTEVSASAALRNAVIKTSELQSFSFTATTTGKVTVKTADAPTALASIESLPTSVTFNFLSKGDMDLRSRENPSVDTSFDGTLETEKVATTSGSLSLAAHQIMFDKNNYLNFSKFEIALTSTDPKLSGAQVIIGVVNGVAASLKNKWIKADSGTSASSTVAGAQSFVMDKKMGDYMSGLSYIKSTTFVGKEQIAGNSTYHMSLVFQYEKELFDILRQAEAENGTLSPVQISAFNKNLDSLEPSFVGKSFTVNMWVGANDPFIYRILVQDFTFEDTVNKFNLTFTQDTTFYNHNKSFSITAPVGATTMQEIIQSVLGSFLGNAREKGADASIKSSLTNLRAQAELYYDKNGMSYGAKGNCSMSSTGATRVTSGSCTQNIMGDKGFNQGMKTAVTASGATGYANVATTGQAWAAFVPLKSAPTTWWCVDSKGSAKVLPFAPAKTATICS